MLHPRRRETLLSHFRQASPDGLASAWLEAMRCGQDPDEAAPEPLLDDWSELVRAGLAQLRLRRQGHVYVAAYLPHRDVFKVGQTAGDPAGRVLRLRTAGVLAPLVLVASRKVPDRHATEAMVHRNLAGQRVEREFFQADHATVVSALDRAAAEEALVWRRAMVKAGLPVDGTE